MAKCKNCTNLIDAVNLSSEGEHEFKWCQAKDDCPDIEIERECEGYEAATRADRIQSMTDEELGQAMFNFMLKLAVNPDYVMSPSGYTEWLQSPVEV